MSDFADLAAAREQELRDDALEAQARRSAAAFLPRTASEREAGGTPAFPCAICAEPIPLARQRALPGVQTCVDCQRELEFALERSGK